MNTFTRHISIQSTYSKSSHEFIQHKSIQTWLLSYLSIQTSHSKQHCIFIQFNQLICIQMKWSTRDIPWLAHDHPISKLQLISLQAIKYINKSSTIWMLHLYVDSSWTSLSCHGIGIIIIICQYLAQSHDQHNEYHLNQASNAHGTYK